ncbi:MAG: PKD domain-containing protein [Lewinellaceae bacterium]|nr:PKD domain-containing protein [Lewinellaceae bacterium]
MESGVRGQILAGQGRDKVRMRWNAGSSEGMLTVDYYNCYLGCAGKDTIIVKIRDPFGITGPLEVCEGGNGSFNASTNAHPPAINISCNWILQDMAGNNIWASATASSQANISFNFTPGQYLLRAVPDVIAQNSTCSNVAEWTVFVRPQPSQPSGISGPVYFCPNENHTFTALGVSPGAEVIWKVNSNNFGPSSRAGNPLVTSFFAGAPRWLEASQISTDGLGCKSDPVHLDVQQLPNLVISGTPAACIYAEGFYATTALPGFDYQWELFPADAGVIESGQGSNIIAVFWKRPGNHTVKLVVCGQNSQINVEVWPEPSPSVAGPAGACAGGTALMTAGAGFNNYIWKDSLGAVLGSGINRQLTAGDYALVATDSHGCIGTSTFTLEEYPVPNVSLSTVDPTYFCNNSIFVHMVALVEVDGDFDFEWFKDGSALGNNQATYVTNQYGDYTVQVANQYGCTASDGPIHVVEYCGPSGVCHNPGHPPCPPGSIDILVLPTPQCDSVQFQVIAGPDYVAGTAHWDFGISGSILVATSYVEDPTIVFPNAGKYIAILSGQMSDGSVCQTVDSVDVEAQAQLAVLQFGCSEEAINLQDESTFLPGGGITQWEWSFGDPASGAANNSMIRMPTHTFDQPGLYTLQLTVTASSGCTSTTTGLLRSYPAPQPDFVLPVQNCSNTSLPFSWPGGAEIASIQWDFFDIMGTQLDAIRGLEAWQTFNSPADYPVRITASNINGCTATFTDTLSIQPNPLSGVITPASNINICEGQNITLTAPAGGVQYDWTGGASGQMLNVTLEGVYKVTVTDANGCTFVPAPQTVYVTPAPDGIIKAYSYDEYDHINGIVYSPLTVCDGENIHLVVQDNGTYQITWTTGENSVDLIFSDDRGNLPGPGTYNYAVTITNQSTGCTAELTPFDVTVNPLPSGFTAMADQFCAGIPSNVSLSGAIDPLWQVYWNNGATGPGFSTALAGQYQARVVNQFGCSDTSNTVSILPGPNIAAIPGGCHTRCRPDTICVPNLPDIVSAMVSGWGPNCRCQFAWFCGRQQRNLLGRNDGQQWLYGPKRSAGSGFVRWIWRRAQ